MAPDWREITRTGLLRIRDRDWARSHPPLIFRLRLGIQTC